MKGTCSCWIEELYEQQGLTRGLIWDEVFDSTATYPTPGNEDREERNARMESPG